MWPTTCHPGSPILPSALTVCIFCQTLPVRAFLNSLTLESCKIACV